MTDPAQSLLPRYQSHKIVEAAPITAFDRVTPCVWCRTDTETVRIDVPTDFFARGLPAIDDYLVRYEDGYLSWSPKQTFEDGYTRVSVIA